VIFAYGGDVAPHAKKATPSIPIVAMVSNDPVQSGLVASMSRPGGNVTGTTMIYDELSGKLVELLKEAVPTIARVAVLWNPNHADPEFRETQRASSMSGVTLQSLEVRTASDFAGAFDAALREHAEGLIIVSSRLLLSRGGRLSNLAQRTASSWPGIGKNGPKTDCCLVMARVRAS
jgi:putative ABC transport system substrate-binding protein